MVEATTAEAGSLALPGKDELLTWLRQMCEIRNFEDTVYELLGRDVIKGASHLYAGEEAVAVGAVAALTHTVREPGPVACDAHARGGSR